jgi:hypothetical protein
VGIIALILNIVTVAVVSAVTRPIFQHSRV